VTAGRQLTVSALLTAVEHGASSACDDLVEHYGVDEVVRGLLEVINAAGASVVADSPGPPIVGLARIATAIIDLAQHAYALRLEREAR
jgi:hypothetical protein